MTLSPRAPSPRRTFLRPYAAFLALAACPWQVVAQPILFDGFEDQGTRGWRVTFPATCSDGRQNGDETGVDCGGTACVSCAVSCPERPFGAIGGPCTVDVDCVEAGSICFRGDLGGVVFPPEGYCMAVDPVFTDPLCATDEDCPAGTLCSRWIDFDGYRHCMPVCSCPGEACPDHQACRNSFNGSRLDNAVCTPGTAGVPDGAACAGMYECDEFSVCRGDIEHPGGECRRDNCLVGDATTCNGGHCIEYVDPPTSGTTCVDGCAVDGDCREAEGYRCFDPGGGAQRYCRHPRVGDPCGSAANCGAGVWTCKVGAAFPGGYCTVVGCPTHGSSQGCSTGSVCYDSGLPESNYCVDGCTGSGQGTCRAGYLCTSIGASGLRGCVSL